MAVSISGMFGNGNTYFANSPVVITVSGLEWGNGNSPFKVVRIKVIYDSGVVGEFPLETGGQTSIDCDISSALRAIWAGYDFSSEVAKANEAAAAQDVTSSDNGDGYTRERREYSLQVYTEYLDSQDGELTITGPATFTGGYCMLGGFTEMERLTLNSGAVSGLEYTNTRNGDGSTKPKSTPERVGKNSITSWVDLANTGTTTRFYPKEVTPAADGTSAHAPQVLRDSIPYQDFLFVNRRGAVETCSALMLESMDIETETKQYARVQGPSFTPSRSLLAVATGGRRSWSMSSGHQDRDWAEWWALEFLRAKQWWMRYPATNTFVPVTVQPAKKQTTIYDRTKQEMPHVEFTVTLALEG